MNSWQRLRRPGPRPVRQAPVRHARDRGSRASLPRGVRAHPGAANRGVPPRSLPRRTWAAIPGNARQSRAACVLWYRGDDEARARKGRGDPPRLGLPLPRAEDPACSGGGLHDRAAYAARAMLQARIEARKDLRQLSLNVADRNPFQMEPMPAVFAVPREAVQFVRAAPPLDHHAYAAGGALRRMRHFRGQQIHLAFPNGHIHQAAVLHRLEHHVPLDLEKKLFAWIVVIVLAWILSPDRHGDEG